MSATMAVFVEVMGHFSWMATSISVILHFILFTLMGSATPPEFGNYPRLIIVNSLNLMVFSFLHAFIEPIIAVEKNVVYVVAAKNLFCVPQFTMRLMLATYGATYCMTLVICAVTFVYRYSAVCNSLRELFSTPNRIYIWYVIFLCLGFFWGYCIFNIAVETPYVDSIIEKPLQKFYELSLPNVTYVAAVYKIYEPTGEYELNDCVVFMGASFLIIIGSSMIIAVICVWRISRRAAKFKNTPIGEQTQRQLFMAQCFQMAIPFSLIFFPVFGILLMPLFNLDGNISFSIVSVLVALYPVVDPLAIIFLISQYRHSLRKSCGCYGDSA